MAKTIVMPKLGVTMDEGKITEWKKQVKDPVQQGELLVIIETDKVALEYESPESGTVGKIYAQVGDVVPVGHPICEFAEPGETFAGEGARQALAGSPAVRSEGVAPVAAQISSPEQGESEEQVKAVPLVRKMAAELGIPLAKVKGTGQGGRITKDDLLRFAEERKGAAKPRADLPEKVPSVPASVSPSAPAKPVATAGERKIGSVIPLSGMRGIIAKRMTASFQNPQGTQFLEIDMTETLALRDAVKEGVEKLTGEKFTLTALLVKTVALGLREHPVLNSIVEENQVKIIENINMGIASALEDGLIVPVLQDVQGKSLAEIVCLLAGLTRKAREKKLNLADISGGTFTLTNMGMYGSQFFTPLLNPPETAILGVGMVQKKPVVMGDEVRVRPMGPFSLAFDHRALDGAPAATFFARVKEMLETPWQKRVTDVAF